MCVRFERARGKDQSTWEYTNFTFLIKTSNKLHKGKEGKIDVWNVIYDDSGHVEAVATNVCLFFHNLIIFFALFEIYYYNFVVALGGPR